MRRKVLAWILLVLGLGCGIAGALVLTVFAPPSRIDVVERSDDPGIAVVSAPGLLELTGSAARVRVTAASGADVFLAVARADDVTAWLGDARHTEVTGITGDLAAPRATTTVRGDAAAVDPRTADIWLTSTTGSGTVQLDWTTTSDDQYDDAGGVVLFAATDGTAAAPQQVAMSWQTDGAAATHPLGVPLVVVGCVLAVLGALGVLFNLRLPRLRRSA